MSAALPTPAAPVPPRPRRRWVRRGLLAAGLLLLILVLFHRPFGHWAIRHFGGSALAKSGITGEWRTSGSLLNGLVIDDLKLTGNPTSQLRTMISKRGVAPDPGRRCKALWCKISKWRSI